MVEMRMRGEDDLAQGLGRVVDHHEGGFVDLVGVTEEYQRVLIQLVTEHGEFAAAESWMCLADFDDSLVKLQRLPVPALLIPNHGTAAIGIVATVHADFLAVVKEWDAGQRELRDHRELS